MIPFEAMGVRLKKWVQTQWTLSLLTTIPTSLTYITIDTDN